MSGLGVWPTSPRYDKIIENAYLCAQTTTSSKTGAALFAFSLKTRSGLF